MSRLLTPAPAAGDGSFTAGGTKEPTSFGEAGLLTSSARTPSDNQVVNATLVPNIRAWRGA